MLCLATAAIGQITVVTDPVKVETNIVCPEPCYVAPLVGMSGGFVAERATNEDDEDTMDVDESAVNMAVHCTTPNTIVIGALTVGEDNIVRQHLGMDNGLGCADGYGIAYIDNVKAGGWFWINDEMNSAVSSLVNRSVVMSPGSTVMPLDPDGVTLTMLENDESPATLVKHAESGRIGIIPHLQPEVAMPMCSVTAKKPVISDCVLMPMYRISAMTGVGDRAKDVGMVVTRNSSASGDGAITVTVALAGDGYVTSGDTATTFTIVPDTANGIEYAMGDAEADPATVDRITISSEDGNGTRCDPDAVGTALQDRGTNIKVTVTLATASGYAPAPKFGMPADKGVMQRTIEVACAPVPESPAIQGQELVPDNPFPTNQ